MSISSGNKLLRFIKQLIYRFITLAGASALTLLFFLVLPLMQHLTKPPSNDLVIQNVDTAKLEAPPPPPEEEPEPPKQVEEKPPELTEDAPPLDLSQLELALNPGMNQGFLGGDFAVKLNTMAADNASDVDALFSVAELDQKPRVIYQPGPVLTKEVKKKTPGTVYIIFVVNQQGKVENPTVQRSTDPVFDRPALAAVKQWRFEPGKRSGKPVKFRMRVPISFPKQ